MSDLAEWRKQIDALDRQLVRLLNERAKAVLQLAPLKRQQNIGVLDETREDAVRQNIRDSNEGPLSDEALVEIIEQIMAAMKELQKPR